jgi:hypothetical protein
MTAIWDIDDPDKRYAAVFALAVGALGPEDADLFMDNEHRGLTAQAMGAPDTHTFINPGQEVRASIDAARPVVEYLQSLSTHEAGIS